MHSCAQVDWRLVFVLTALFLLFIELIDLCHGFRAAGSPCWLGEVLSLQVTEWPLAPSIPPARPCAQVCSGNKGPTESVQLRDTFPRSAPGPPSFRWSSSPKKRPQCLSVLLPRSWREVLPSAQEAGRPRGCISLAVGSAGSCRFSGLQAWGLSVLLPRVLQCQQLCRRDLPDCGRAVWKASIPAPGTRPSLPFSCPPPHEQPQELPRPVGLQEQSRPTRGVAEAGGSCPAKLPCRWRGRHG